MTSAIGPFVTQILVPFRFQQPFRKVAVVWIEAASDPLDGSVSENAAIFLPAVRCGRYRRFWASVPPRRIDIDPIEVCAPMMLEKAAEVRPNCSSARQYPRSPAPTPPYSSGKGSPKKPSVPISVRTSLGILSV